MSQPLLKRWWIVGQPTPLSSALVELHKLPVDQVVDMQVTLADGSTVSSGSSCVVPLVVCD